MFTIGELIQPNTLEEAYQALTTNKSSAVLGGCAFLKLGTRKINTAIDLTKLQLDYITENQDFIEIGAMTTFRDMEVNDSLNEYFNGIIPKSVSNIIGVQFRNTVTVGASVFSKYGFSDLIPALLVLNTEVELFNGGRMPLQDFLDRPTEKDILTRVLIKKESIIASYQNLRTSAADFPLLNAAVSNCNDSWLIAVGARPTRAKIALNASKELSKGSLSPDKILQVSELAAEELSFGTNMKATAEYRRAMCKVLVARAVSEVLACK